jgi:hypothetical protein
MAMVMAESCYKPDRPNEARLHSLVCVYLQLYRYIGLLNSDYEWSYVFFLTGAAFKF